MSGDRLFFRSKWPVFSFVVGPTALELRVFRLGVFLRYKFWLHFWTPKYLRRAEK
jgi:hypothetical protein